MPKPKKSLGNKINRIGNSTSTVNRSIGGATDLVRLNSASRPLTMVTEPSPAPTRKSPVLSLHSAVTPLLKFSLGPFTYKHTRENQCGLKFEYRSLKRSLEFSVWSWVFSVVLSFMCGLEPELQFEILLRAPTPTNTPGKISMDVSWNFGYGFKFQRVQFRFLSMVLNL